MKVPVLVVWGADDAWLDPALARRVAALIPGAAARVIAGAGHFAMEDAPTEVTRELLGFFRSRTADGDASR